MLYKRRKKETVRYIRNIVNTLVPPPLVKASSVAVRLRDGVSNQ